MPVRQPVASTSASSKRASSEAADARQARKRTKLSEKNASKAETARLQYFPRVWSRKIAARTELLAGVPTAIDSAIAKKELVKVLNGIRAADKRPSLNQALVNLLPEEPGFSLCLLDLFQHPFTFQPASWSSILAPAKDMEEDRGCDEAQYYLRRLSFADHAALKSFLESITAKRGQYAAHVDALIAGSAEAGDLAKPRSLFYAGFTVATTPVGRELDDLEGVQEGFLHVLLKAYSDPVEVFEARQLAFATGGKDATQSVKLSRGDPPTSLFESALIDCMAFMCLNTAPAGVLELVVDPSMQKILDSIDSLDFGSAASSSTADKGKGKAKAGRSER